LGHVRPGSGPRAVTIEAARAGVRSAATGAFRPTATTATLRSGRVRIASVTPFTTDPSGYFLRFAPYARGTEYRFSYRNAAGQTQTGLAQPPDSCNGKTRQKNVTRAGANEF
jgi:hypothetical protein